MKYESELADRLASEKVISEQELLGIKQHLTAKKFSLHWELRVLLYLGIVMFTGSVGVLIYNNIGSIGHIIVIGLLYSCCVFSYWYIFKNANKFSSAKTVHGNPFYDYIVLLAISLFVIAQGYVQFYFSLTGTSLTIATLTASVIAFVTAFRFDHKGVLGIAISLHALVFGLAITPLDLLSNAGIMFNDKAYIHSGILLSCLLYLYGFICRSKNIKAHFTNTFYQFSANLMLISLMVAVFTLNLSGIYYLVMLGASVLWIYETRRMQSFALYFSTVISNYIVLCYWICTLLFKFNDDGLVLLFFYFTSSAVGLVFLLRNHHKITGHAEVQ